MGLGEVTKQLAKEALLSQLEEPAQLPPAPANETATGVVLAQLQAMQSALKNDQELLVLCTVGKDTVRVFEVFAPSPNLLVLSGTDADRVMTRLIVSVDAVQLVCKPVAVKEGAKANRLRLLLPKAKS